MLQSLSNFCVLALDLPPITNITSTCLARFKAACWRSLVALHIVLCRVKSLVLCSSNLDIIYKSFSICVVCESKTALLKWPKASASSALATTKAFCAGVASLKKRPTTPLISGWFLSPKTIKSAPLVAAAAAKL
ncbi:hypothetical protein SDC9_199429 [bioreactor metagenome]|uniref:Uncharacterized protein n=1 Tax=bioreactor metagenome TaxID=1076179 RepID=A0A645IL06_9ZZZZ